MWNRIKALLIKELLAIWYDKKSRAVLIVPPIFQLFIFTFAATLDVKNVPIGILNLDTGKQSQELVQRFYGSPVFTKIVHLHAREEVQPFIENMEGLMVAAIDQDFSRRIEAEKQANIQLILDGRRSNSTQIVAGYVANIVQQFNTDVMARANIKQQNTELIGRNWFNPNLIYYWYNIPCLSGILTMVVAMLVTSLSIARERELGTFDQLLVSPMQPIEILLGKMLPAIIVSISEALVIVWLGTHLFDVPFAGNFWYLLITMLVFVISIVGVGLFVSSLCQTQQQAVLGSFVFMSPSVLLSGFATPIENMPTWLQPVTLAVPLRYYLINAKGIFLKDIPADIVFNNIWPMAIIAVFTLSAAVFLFRRRLE